MIFGQYPECPGFLCTCVCDCGEVSAGRCIIVRRPNSAAWFGIPLCLTDNRLTRRRDETKRATARSPQPLRQTDGRARRTPTQPAKQKTRPTHGHTEEEKLLPVKPAHRQEKQLQMDSVRLFTYFESTCSLSPRHFSAQEAENLRPVRADLWALQVNVSSVGSSSYLWRKCLVSVA